MTPKGGKRAKPDSVPISPVKVNVDERTTNLAFHLYESSFKKSVNKSRKFNGDFPGDVARGIDKSSNSS